MLPQGVQIASLPGWMFAPTALAPLSAGTQTLPWQAALDPGLLRRTLASLPGPCILMAWSLGALAALRLASDPPDALTGLVLLGATAFLPADPATGYDGVAPATLTAMRRRLRRDPAGLFREFYARCLFPGIPAPSAAEVFVAEALAQDATLADAGLATLASLDLRRRLDAIRIPVALLHGEADAVVPVSQAQFIAHSIPHATLRVLPRCGHLPTESLLEMARNATGLLAGKRGMPS